MDEIQTFDVTIAGARLMMHNGRLADPLDPYTKALKEITGKRKKSDADHVECGRREFVGGLYWRPELGPYVPGDALLACIVEGARKRKLGKAFEPAVRLTEDYCRLKYEGPREPDALWADARFVDRRGVVVGQSRVIRTRPIFNDWAVSFTIELLPSQLNAADVEQALVDGGIQVGLLEMRPRLGAFSVESFAAAATQKRSKKKAA